MKIKELHINVNELYQVSYDSTTNDIFMLLPENYNEYIKRLSFSFSMALSDMSIMKTIENILFETNDLEKDAVVYFKQRLRVKNIVLIKKIHWLNFYSGDNESVKNNSFIPIVEVLDVKRNLLFFIKPNKLIELMDGDNKSQDDQIEDKNIKNLMLQKLNARKQKRTNI